MDLHQWGWSPDLQQAFGLLEHTLTPARVARQDRTGHLVVHAGGEGFARLPGHLRAEPPAVGDWVGLDLREPPTIRAVLPRRSAFTRQAAGRETRAQVVAANVDVLFIVAGLDGDLNLRRLERYLVLAAASGARPILVLNKADAADAVEERLAEVRAVAAGATILLASARTGAGVDALARLVPAGVTAAFVGSSGVGKSSLVNRLRGEEAMETGALRAKDGRGRHTTTARHLLELPGGGILLDTPGMRELALLDVEEGVAAVFGDIDELAAGCRFRDCAHDREPGCAVRAAVSAERLDSWRKLQREAAAAARRGDAAATRRAAREWGRIARRSVDAKRERLGR